MVWSLIRGLFSPQPTVTITVQRQLEDPEITNARYAATAHAQFGEHGKAVAELERVRQLETADGGEAETHSEIRRAKYLQKAGQGDEAWRVFSSLLDRHGGEPWTIIDLFDAMRLHLQREGKGNEAIAFGVAHRLSRIKLYRGMKAEAEAALQGPIEAFGSERLERMMRQNHQSSIELAERWLSELTDPTDLQKMATALCKKAGTPDESGKLAQRLKQEIEAHCGPFDYLKAEGVSL